MATTSSATLTIPATQQALWEILSDPHHQPRWWPGVERVEGVTEDQFTQVLKTRRGRPVRADFRVARSSPPWLIAWDQQLAGTPFARVLRSSVIQIDLEPAPAATKVTITHEQAARGYSRTGGRMIRRATESRLQEAVAALARLV